MKIGKKKSKRNYPSRIITVDIPARPAEKPEEAPILAPEIFQPQPAKVPAQGR